MKTLYFFMFISISLISCEQKPANPVAEYGDTMINAYQKGKLAGETGNLVAVRNAIQAYHAANDRYPQKLDEIKGLLGSELDFSKYDYDPQNGTVDMKRN